MDLRNKLPSCLKHGVGNRYVQKAQAEILRVRSGLSYWRTTWYDAGKYRLMMKAKDAAAARTLPPVQRPGTAATRAEREQSDLRALNARLSSSGDLKDAVALYQARRAGRP
jgi:phage terminase large subunit